MLQNKKSHHIRSKPLHRNEEEPLLAETRESLSKEDLAQTKINTYIHAYTFLKKSKVEISSALFLATLKNMYFTFLKHTS